MTALVVVAIALAVWGLLGVVFRDDLRDLDHMTDFEDQRNALSRASKTDNEPRRSARQRRDGTRLPKGQSSDEP